MKISPGDWAGDAIIGDRSSQQDAYRVAELGGGLLMALADGMGGHEGGAEAAEVAVNRAIRALADTSNITADTLHQALLSANNAVGEARAAHDDDAYDGMGCTLVLAHISDKGLIWASVGDSPLWLIRRGAVIRINRDHSMAPTLAYMVKQGELTEEQAATDPRRNQLRSALMGEALPLVDAGEPAVALKPDDRVVLASDGLLGLDEAELARLSANAAGADTICTSLLQAVRAKVDAGLDNTTVIVYAARKAGWLSGLLGRFGKGD